MINEQKRNPLEQTVGGYLADMKLTAFVDTKEVVQAFLALGPRASVFLLRHMLEADRQLNESIKAKADRGLLELKAANFTLEEMAKDAAHS